jgi:hypothetical protein
MKVLVEWEAPRRRFTRRSRSTWIFYGIFVGLMAVVGETWGNWVIAMLILALGFLSYVYWGIEPTVVINRLTSDGVETGGRRYRWERLGGFRVRKEGVWTVVEIEIRDGTGKLKLLIDAEQTLLKKVGKTLKKYLNQMK